ncbi:pilin N-terminal domain-containing protein [Hespellia stercorisuis]|uniref:Gram-positive pilin subunit D1 N-terminal domain-containing protein n=1 Tax=Hespellia stercorisuis DSM 15480 TaxID=1121950 RepID=A0A1M6I376_9FIRM|nr:pilin N-terminal domain-containing protein [Hespellia stercorisuis]SHJ28835.1 hypothetical protein SAMN02745243_00205 [Hespellia stercorisuis DSM 15480]
MINRIHRTIYGCVLLLVMLLSSHLAVWAQDSGSITVEAKTSRNEQTIYLSGDTFAVTQIADAQVLENGGIVYTTREKFSQFETSWDEKNASQLNTLASQLETYINQNHLEEFTQVTASDGTALFQNLNTGIYLVFRQKADEANKGYTTAPALISIPDTDAGNYLYQVKADLKINWEDKPIQESPKEPEVEKPSGGVWNLLNSVKTGDSTVIVGWILLGILALFIILILIRKRKNVKSNIK